MSYFSPSAVRRRRRATSNNVIQPVSGIPREVDGALDSFIAADPTLVTNDGNGEGIDTFLTEVPVTKGEGTAILKGNMQGELQMDSELHLEFEETQIISFMLSPESSEDLTLTGIELVARPGHNFMQVQLRERTGLFNAQFSSAAAVLLISPKFLTIPDTSWQDMGSSGDFPTTPDLLKIRLYGRDADGFSYKGSTAIFKG